MIMGSGDTSGGERGATAGPELPRRSPSTVPGLVPVPEYAAGAEMRARYAAMKAGFGVPWMGVVGMAHAQYRRFYDALWRGLEPIAATAAWHEGCARLRAAAEAGVGALAPATLEPRLRELGYAPGEVVEIRAVLEVFSHGNHPYILLATLSRHLLAGGELGTDPGSSAPVRSTPAPARPALMERHHADAPTRALYDDIQAVLDLPILNTDYRALARWPSYFTLAWADLRPRIRGPVHAALSQRLHDLAVDTVRGLPNPAGLRGEAVRAAAGEDASVEEVAAMAELFQWLLPELAVNVAFFRRQLLAPVG